MGGGVIIGALWGVVVAAVVLAAVSLSTPLPPRPDAIPEVMDDSAADLADPVEEALDPGDPVPLPEGSGFNRVPPEETGAAPEVDASVAGEAPASAGGVPDSAFASAPEPEASVAEPPAAPVLAPAPSSSLPQISGEIGTEVPPAAPRRLTVPEASNAPRETDVSAPAVPPTGTDAPDDVAAVDLPETPAPLVPSEDAATPQTEAQTAPEASLPDTPEVPPVPATTPDASPPEVPDAPAPAADALPAPEAPRLPQIGAAPAPSPEPDSDPEPEVVAAPERGLPQIAGAPEPNSDRFPRIAQPTPEGAAAMPGEAAPDAAAPQGALVDNAAPFDGSEDRPLMAIILIDDPEAGLDTATLTRFTFPVAFAVDPLSDGAATRATAYRDAGFEVVILGDILPEGATAADAETAVAAAQAVLPQAVALLDTPESRIQGDRPVLDATVAALAETGHGLVAFPRGLNAAEQTAARADVPAATLFRLLDDEDQRATVITRYLARAGFAAVSEGSVVVAGRTRPDTVTALFSWALGSRSEAVAIAPLSAVLLRGVE